MSIIFTFSSGLKPDLFAFAGDRSGSRLPDKFGPWLARGIVRADNANPHKLDRETIERAIEESGYQLWRMKKAK